MFSVIVYFHLGYSKFVFEAPTKVRYFILCERWNQLRLECAGELNSCSLSLYKLYFKLGVIFKITLFIMENVSRLSFVIQKQAVRTIAKLHEDIVLIPALKELNTLTLSLHLGKLFFQRKFELVRGISLHSCEIREDYLTGRHRKIVQNVRQETKDVLWSGMLFANLFLFSRNCLSFVIDQLLII